MAETNALRGPKPQSWIELGQHVKSPCADQKCSLIAHCFSISTGAETRSFLNSQASSQHHCPATMICCLSNATSRSRSAMRSWNFIRPRPKCSEDYAFRYSHQKHHS